MRHFFVSAHFLLIALGGFSQSTYVPYNKDYYWLLDRYEIKSNHLTQQFHSSFHSYQRQNIVSFINEIEKDTTIKFSVRDSFNLQFIKNDNWDSIDSFLIGNSKKPFLKHFYQKQNALFSHRDKDFDLLINPILYLSDGREFVNEKLNSNSVLLNTRGIEVRGMIGKKLGFYSMLTDNQAMFPTYVMDRIDSATAVPEEAYYKYLPGSHTKLYRHFFKSTGVDFFTARGYVTFDIIKKLITVQVGQDKNFLGNGYRSLLLSDFSSPYLFAKITTKVWKFNYTLLYAQLSANTSTTNYTIFPKKYLALHHLSMNVGKHLNIGLFESVVQDRGDINYYNPIIFYKAIVNQLGAKDKAIIGLDMKVNFARHFSIYGQFVINEFVFNAITAGNGFWANKQAGQIGFKYIDVLGIRNLDLQLETNIVRPYVYSARDSSITAYTNYNTPLAHPLGANFYEFLGIIRYQPSNRLNLISKAFYIIQGLDIKGQNWGANPLHSYVTRVREYGNYIGQGDLSHTIFLDFTATYMLKHNLFIELKQIIRNQNSASGQYNLNTTYTSAGLRWNIQPRLQEF
ncbi:MAG TPA: hypothetical protein VNW99_12935 [Cytophagaceae bacterium]|nr:hypothetical protein [Cytophagaceae bacterium]